jgi:indole-3-glycerol phosphate synthase
MIPDSIIKVAESGVHTPADAKEYHAAGADAILVGESLVKAANPSTAVANLQVG